MVAAEEWESWERISWGTSSHEQQPPIDSLLEVPTHPPTPPQPNIIAASRKG